MKALFSLLIVSIATLAQAQGNIGFGNSQVTPISIRSLDGTVRLATAADNLLIGVFFSANYAPADSFVLVPGLATIGSIDGVMVNAPSVFPISGTEPMQEVWIQVRAWDAALGLGGWHEARRSCVGNYYGETQLSPFVLGPTEGPGTPIWQPFGGLHPTRFYPLTIYTCPEPSVVAFALLAGLCLWITRRKQASQNSVRRV